MGRLGYGLATGAAVLLGLGSRHYAARLPDWLADNAGDALWAAMIYFGCRALRPDLRLRFAAIAGLAFCFAVEGSQLAQAEWLNRIRHTTIGGLVLGQGFLAVDLVRYAVGIAAALLADAARLHFKQRA